MADPNRREKTDEQVDLLKAEGANPKIVKHNGFWNVEAERGGMI
jgi:hypothetical protein